MPSSFMGSFMTRGFVVIAILLAIWIGIATKKEMDRGERIQEEIASLHAEADKTQRENNTLKEKIRYFQTDAFQEQEARNKLNYQAENERAVVIKSTVGDQSVQEQPEKKYTDTKRESLLPNYTKWWNTFFALDK